MGKTPEVGSSRGSKSGGWRDMEMKRILCTAARWGGALLGKAKQAMLRVKLPGFPLSVIIAFCLLALAGGWVGGMWAPRPSPQQGISPVSRGIPPDRPGQEEGSSNGTAYLGLRGRAFHQGELRGVKVLDVFPDSPAARAGLRSDRGLAPDYVRKAGGGTGHIIVGANGRAIRSEEDLAQLLALSAPGSVVKFLVTSADGNYYEVVPVTLGSTAETSPPVEASAGQKTLWPSRPEEPPERQIVAEIFREVNRAREKKGLHPLKENPQLQRVARRHSEDMATRHFTGHLNPDGQDVVDRLRAEGIEEFIAVGENIFTGKGVADPAPVAVREWLKSPGHRKNLLNPRYTEGGIGIAEGETDAIYITQVFLER